MTSETLDPAMPVQPDPARPTSVAGLAYELRILQSNADGISVRELATRAKIPTATVQDALRGNRGQPRYETFVAVVRALGVLEAEVPRWRDAWVRVRQYHRGLREPAQALVAPAQTGPPAVPPVAGRRIEAVNQAQGATLIEQLPLLEVVEQLAEMDRGEAARRLDLVQPTRSAAVLAALSETVAGAIVAAMAPRPSTAALEAMDTRAAGQVLLAAPPMLRTQTVARLPPALVAAILQETPNGGAVLANLGTPADFRARVLESMPIQLALQLLAGPLRTDAAAILLEGARAGLELPTRVLAAADPQLTTGWLPMFLNDDAGTRVLATLPDNRLVLLMLAQSGRQGDEAWLPRKVLQQFGEERLVALLRRMEDQARDRWIRPLLGHLSSQAIRDIRRAQ